MKSSKILTAVFLVLLGISGNAAEISPEARLRKLSMRVRGIAPKPAEIEALQQAKMSGQLNEFFSKTATDYSHSTWGDVKLTERLMEDLRVMISMEPYVQMFRGDSGLARTFDIPAMPVAPQRNDPLRDLLRYQIQNDVSWSNIIASDAMTRTFLLRAIHQNLRQVSSPTNPRSVAFKKRATELGYKVSTEEEMQIVIRDYLADPQKFVGELPVPKDQKEAYLQLISSIGGKSANELGFIAFLNDLATTGNATHRGTNYNMAGLADYFSRTNGVTDTTPSGEKAYQVPGLAKETAFSVSIPESKIKLWACAIRYFTDTNKSISSTRLSDTMCGAVTPFASAEPELNEVEVAAKIETGYFSVKNEKEIFEYISKNFEKFSEWNRKRTSQFGQFGQNQAKANIPTVFTNAEFIQRYSKTPYSAPAALFRIAMCDEMKLVALIDASKKSQDAFNILKMLMGTAKPGAQTGANNLTPMMPAAVDPHVKGSCMGCHRKLDPAQEILGAQGDKKIEFVYDDAEGKEHRVQMSSMKEFPKMLSEQPQFIRCQTEKFWSWIVGEDVQLNQSRRAALIKTFTDLKMNPRKFVAYLSNLPEFYNDDAPLAPAGMQPVRQLLQRCNGCHSGEGTVPSFTDLPINLFGTDDKSNHDEHVNYLKDIVKMTKLLDDGAQAKMPPQDAGWSMTDEHRKSMMEWIWNGALDDSGKPTINNSERDFILKGITKDQIVRIQPRTKAVATFRPTWKRFQENFDILKILVVKMPVRTSNCTQLLETNRSGVGVKDINTGSPDSDRPTKAFREFYGACLKSVISEMDAYTSGGSMNEAIRLSIGLKASDVANGRSATLWSAVPEMQKIEIVQNVIEYYIGKNVLGEEKGKRIRTAILRSLEAHAKATPTLTMARGGLAAAYMILNDDEFLTN